MTKPLNAKHALVTGGGSGIGAAIAARLAALGARVTLVGRSAEKITAMAAELGAPARAHVCDITDEAAVSALFASLGPVDILVNNAGAAQSAPFHKTGDDLWRTMMAVNLDGPFYCARAALPAMRKAGWGRIITVASTAGITGYAYVAAYCAAKHGVVGMTRALALETARDGITANCLCPGYTQTDLVAETIDNIVAKTGRTPEEAYQELAKTNPQGRLVQPGEVAAAAAWLCLPGSDAITGQAIAIAGGEVL